ncbi:MAG: molybdenum ABC transporter ATP-binding protein, partial [Prevotella sp.]|nr:molybdenum ABC transporter ATP-binding protein [Prevotella sp.]
MGNGNCSPLSERGVRGESIIKIHNGVTRMPEWRMAEPVNFELDKGEHIAIVA